MTRWQSSSYRATRNGWTLSVGIYVGEWWPTVFGPTPSSPLASLGLYHSLKAAKRAAVEYADTHCPDGRCFGLGVVEVVDFTGPGWELCGCKDSEVDPAVIERIALKVAKENAA